MQTTVIWLSLFVLFLVIEIITMGLTTIWFAGGALVAFLVAVLGLAVVGCEDRCPGRKDPKECNCSS